eukprot:3987629-Ditylum_brightwellii.AAC.1
MHPISKGKQGGTVSSILVLDELNNTALYEGVTDDLGFRPAWLSLDDEDKVVLTLLKQNKLHLHQAWDTPCARGEVKQYLGDSGLGQDAQDIIEGNFDPNIAENLPVLNHWLRHNIQQLAPKGSITVNLTLQQYKYLFKVQDESTSSSPSGRHYGHYKAALILDSISQVHAWMMSMPFLAGLTPTRWQNTLDCMLEKDAGSPKITGLQIIVIVEGDMNAIMKVIWNRCLVPVAEKTGMLSLVQFGNRKGWTTLDALLLKVVTMDCLQLFQLNGAILNNDVTACYNRMIPELSSLHVQSLGLPDNATKRSILLNHDIKHFVKTNTGITKDFYKHKPSDE